MKKFVYIEKVIKTSKTYGRRTVECGVYQVKQGKDFIEGLGTCTYNTGSTKGARSVVNDFLLKNGHITRAMYNEKETKGYYMENDKYKIVKLS